MIKRQAELKELNALYEKKGNQLILLIGTAESGREDLLRDFCENKSGFYFRARNASDMAEREAFLHEITTRANVKLHESITKSDERLYESAFEAYVLKNREKPVVVLDEFQLMMKQNGSKEPDILTAVSKLRSGKLTSHPVTIVLGISSLVWAEQYAEKLNADITINLSDISFLELVRAFPQFSVSESVKTYGILGGVPEYLNLWNPRRSIRDNICETILSPESPLFHKVQTYLSTELRELSVYNTILASIAAGNEKLNDLYADTGYSRAKISVYMKNLAAIDVVEKVESLETGGYGNAKKGVYRIKHHFVNFYFRFLYPHLSDLYLLTPKQFYEAHIAGELDAYLKRFFVDVCHEYLELLNRVGRAPIKIEKMGTWVGKSGTIDVVGEDAIRQFVVGICNWEEETMPFAAYEQLLENMKLARIKAKAIFLFSATAFDAKLTALAEEDDSIVLVDMKEL